VATLVLFLVWGVKAEHLFVTLSSVFAVIGIGLFAQWSILSNVTSGIVLFFAFPFKIGDVIRIHDKDFPIEGEIEDIKSFYIYLKTSDNEMAVFPNSLVLQKGVSILKKQKPQLEFTD
jgi:small-conductance mechanosensitive channel